MLQNIQDKTKTTIIRKQCPFCKKPARAISTNVDDNEITTKLECGHSVVEYGQKIDESWKCSSLSGKEPFKYQYVTNDFVIKAGHRAGIFHEQGVGKTICSLLPIKQFPEKMLPAIIFCKSSLKMQWWKEILEWTGLPAQIIDNSRERPFPDFFKIFIVSYDLTRNINWIKDLKVQYAILDECQQIKNSQAKRTQSLREAVRDIPCIIGLSGTPIKNHAGEYFPILNILHPEIFFSQAQFERDFCDTYSNGYSYKIGGLSRYNADRFHDLTKDWIIRYTRDEVLPDLPKIFRKNYFVELGPAVESAYKKAFIDAREEYEGGNSSFEDQGNLLAKLNILRHITGVSKIEPVSEFVREFLEDCERKIVLFVHHKDVGTGLSNRIGRIARELGIKEPLQLTSDMSGKPIGNEVDERFKTDPSERVMIASTLSAGEGKNWQMCSDMIMVEHQWNPANEEQCEGRFPRPGSIAESISATYAIALGTPDEYLTEIKERKREICKKTMGNEAVAWDQSSTIKEMCELLFSKGAKKWKL